METKNTTENHWLISFEDPIDYYMECIREFGAIPLLLYLNELKTQENYSECNFIKKAFYKYDEIHKTELHKLNLEGSLAFIKSKDKSNTMQTLSYYYFDLIKSQREINIKENYTNN